VFIPSYQVRPITEADVTATLLARPTGWYGTTTMIAPLPISDSIEGP